MKNSVSIYDQEQIKLQQYTDLVTTDLEAFRREATRIYRLYIPSERKFLSKFESATTSSYDVLSLWENSLLPVLQVLRGKRSELAFRNLMVKHLVLDTDETQASIHNVINLRESEVIQKFINSLYGVARKKDVHRKQRAHINDLLLLFQQEILDLKEHHVNYMLYKHIAEQQKVTIVDPHASFRMRMKYSRRVRRERKNIIRLEKARLAFIEKRMSELRNVDNGILTDIFDKGIDLVVVIGLRNQYEKKIAKLSASDVKSVAKRLAIFDAETQEFRNKYTDKLANTSADTGLELARTITKSIDALLLHIFDLNLTGKNQLLLYTKEYRELSQEQANILHTQKTRSI